MSTAWQIKGEAGRALDATLRSLESLGITNTKLTFATLASDTFEWTGAIADATGTGAIIPDAGQVIEVFHNGTRRFRGHVTVPRLRTDRVEIRAEGPWWWMQRISLTSDQEDEASVMRERPVFVFPTQSLKVSIESLIDRLIANGVPMQRGTVADMFSFPRITLAEKSGAQAFADLMSICPDAVSYFDYSGASGTLPSLNVARRGAMTSETLTLGVDGVEVVDIWPRIDLEVASIKVGAAKRNATTGATEYQEQTSGTPAAGKNQVIVISGPEIGDFLPEDKDNTTQVQTFTMPTGGTAIGSIDTSTGHSATAVTGNARTFAITRDEQIATLSREYGTDFTNNLFLSNGGHFLVSAFITGNLSSGAQGILLDRPNLISVDSTTGMFPIFSGGLVPDWLEDENGYTVTDATFVAYVRYTAGPLPSVPVFWDECVRRAERTIIGYPANTGSSSSSSYQYNAFFLVRIPCKLISASFASLTTIYRAWAYDYVQPPAGLADGLLAAQDWVPYEGRIRTAYDDVDGAQALHKKYRLAGGYAPHATMDALPKTVRYDIERGRREIILGAPARVDFGSLAQRFRRHPKDNIVYI